MASVGPNSPGTINNIDNGGAVAWVNPGNAASSNNSYATWTSTANNPSDYLQFVNFGFAIDAGATIDGFLVEIEWFQSAGSVIQPEELKLENNGGTSVGDDKALVLGSYSTTLIPTSEAYTSFGGSSDTWSTGYTPADVNLSDFGVAFIVRKTSGGTSQSVSVDHVRITVYYTTPAGTAASQTLTSLGCGT